VNWSCQPSLSNSLGPPQWVRGLASAAVTGAVIASGRSLTCEIPVGASMALGTPNYSSVGAISPVAPSFFKDQPDRRFAYAFPSAANSRSRRPAAQIALVPLSCVAFSPSAVFTFTVASSTAYDPRTTRPLNTVVISLQIIGVATEHPHPKFSGGRAQRTSGQSAAAAPFLRGAKGGTRKELSAPRLTAKPGASGRRGRVVLST
jgi:hypothetical protein